MKDFEDWMKKAGMPDESAKQIKEEIDGPLNDWAIKFKASDIPLSEINDPKEFKEVRKKIESIGDFQKKGSKGKELYNAAMNKYSQYLSKLSPENISEDQLMSKEEIDESFWKQILKSKRDTRENRRKRLQAIGNKKPDTVEIRTVVYKRNPDVVVEVLERAKGKCERCKQPAPFIQAKDGMPYLEVHHILPLEKGGDDSVENAAALCPNCHREVHLGVRRKKTQN